MTRLIFFPDQTILQGFWPYLVHKCPWFFFYPLVFYEREPERGNEGVCLGEKLTIGGQNSPGLPKSLSLLTITICCYSKCASKLVKSLKVFVQLCWLWAKNLPGHYKKKTVPISLHKPFFAPLFFRFCLNLNQMLLDSFIYTPMKLNLCGVLLKLSMY